MKLPLFLLLSLPLASAAVSALEQEALELAAIDGVAHSDEEMALFNIMNILEVETEIATKSRVNADYVPGIVTVLRGEQLQALGMEDVHAAMQLVPGANRVTNNYGRKGVTVRGIGGAFGSSNLKLMLNGHAVNSNFSVAAPHLMNLPIEQVERIEVIRGPGSVLYGEYAFSGVVNVVTHTEENRGFVGYGRYGSPIVGGVFNRALNDEVSFSLNFSAKESEGSRHPSGIDQLSNSATVNTHREFANLFATLQIEDTLLEAHYMKNGKGDHFGIGDRQPPEFDGVVVSDELLKLDLTHPFSVTGQLQAELQLDYSSGGFDMDEIYVLGNLGAASRVGDVHYREARYDANLEFVWSGVEHNRLLFGVHYADVAITDQWQRINYNPSNFNHLGAFSTVNLVSENAERTISSLYLQDQYEVNERVTVTVGGRFDHYSDMGGATTPTLSALYELDEENILKAQYAEAFRPPSFNELYTIPNPVVSGNSALQGESIETSELSYIHKEGARSLRSTLFYSRFENLIYKDGTTLKYENSGEGWHRGVELEAEQVLSDSWKVDGNLTWVETCDSDTDRDLAGAPEWLGNLNLGWKPHADRTLTAHLRFVGERNRGDGDSRSELDGFQTLDLTAGWENLSRSQLHLRAGVRNLFDADVRYPAAPSTYRADYPQQGRSWWLTLARDF